MLQQIVAGHTWSSNAKSGNTEQAMTAVCSRVHPVRQADQTGRSDWPNQRAVYFGRNGALQEIDGDNQAMGAACRYQYPFEIG